MANLENPITTQEELDAIIGERLRRDREKTAKQYEGYISPADMDARIKDLTDKLTEYKGQLTDYKGQLDAKDKELKSYEAASVKSRIADEVGLDRRLIGRLSGGTEEEIRKDAEALKGLFDRSAPVAPLASTEAPQGDAKEAALRGMLKSIKGV